MDRGPEAMAPLSEGPTSTDVSHRDYAANHFTRAPGHYSPSHGLGNRLNTADPEHDVHGQGGEQELRAPTRNRAHRRPRPLGVPHETVQNDDN